MNAPTKCDCPVHGYSQSCTQLELRPTPGRLDEEAERFAAEDADAAIIDAERRETERAEHLAALASIAGGVS